MIRRNVSMEMHGRPEERNWSLSIYGRRGVLFTTAANLSANLGPVPTLYVSPHVSPSESHFAWRLLGFNMWFCPWQNGARQPVQGWYLGLSLYPDGLHLKKRALLPSARKCSNRRFSTLAEETRKPAKKAKLGSDCNRPEVTHFAQWIMGRWTCRCFLQSLV